MELSLQITLRKEGSELQTSFALLDEEQAKAFGLWQGLPETIHALMHCALLLEGRLQLLRIMEEKREVNPKELENSLLRMIQAQAQLLMPQALERCLSELERIQGP